jgi:PST family polysaccharide transporter
MTTIPTESPESDFEILTARQDLQRASVRGGVVTLASQSCKFILQTASLVLLSRWLRPNDFGIVAMVAALIAFAQIFKDLGLSTATIQRAQITHEDVNALFWVNVAVGTALTILTAVAAPLAAWFFKEPRLTGIVLFWSLAFLTGSLGVQHQALLTRRMEFKALALVECGSMLLSVLSGLSLAWAGFGYWALVFSQFVLPTAYSILCWIMCPWRPSRPKWHAGALPMLKFGKDLTGFSVVNYFARNLDNVLIGRYWGPVQLGFYARAYQVLLMPLGQLNAPMQAVALPTLSRLVDEPERYRSAYTRAIRLLSFAAMPLVGFTVMTADWLLPLILGPRWGAAVPMYRWLAVAGFFQPVGSSTGWLFMSQGRGRDMFRWSFISTGFSVASFVIALHWGAVAVAASYALINTLVVCPLLFSYVARRGPVRTGDFYASIALPGSATLVAMAVMALFQWSVPIGNPWLGLAVSTLLWPAIILGFLLILPSGRSALAEMVTLARTHLPAPASFRRISEPAAV